MHSQLVEYDKKEDKITLREDQAPESWIDVCLKFNDDVHRIRDVGEIKGYSGLYECFDDDDTSFYYIVEEDSELKRIKQKHFLDNVGL